MTTNSIFRIASMTKPIVSVAVMMLIEGRGSWISLRPSSNTCLSLRTSRWAARSATPATGNTELVLEPVKRPMTVHDLLRHTAGLVYGQFGDGLVHKAYRDAKVGDRSETNAELITKLSKLPLAHQPGEVWEYSVATDVLGRIIEVVSGMALDAFIEERITKPLGMNSTGFLRARGRRGTACSTTGRSCDEGTAVNVRSQPEAEFPYLGEVAWCQRQEIISDLPTWCLTEEHT